MKTSLSLLLFIQVCCCNARVVVERVETVQMLTVVGRGDQAEFDSLPFLVYVVQKMDKESQVCDFLIYTDKSFSESWNLETSISVQSKEGSILYKHVPATIEQPYMENEVILFSFRINSELLDTSKIWLSYWPKTVTVENGVITKTRRRETNEFSLKSLLDWNVGFDTTQHMEASMQRQGENLPFDDRFTAFLEEARETGHQ